VHSGAETTLSAGALSYTNIPLSNDIKTVSELNLLSGDTAFTILTVQKAWQTKRKKT